MVFYTFYVVSWIFIKLNKKCGTSRIRMKRRHGGQWTKLSYCISIGTGNFFSLNFSSLHCHENIWRYSVNAPIRILLLGTPHSVSATLQGLLGWSSVLYGHFAKSFQWHVDNALRAFKIVTQQTFGHSMCVSLKARKRQPFFFNYQRSVSA
jgi:hypothetical protein